LFLGLEKCIGIIFLYGYNGWTHKQVDKLNYNYPGRNPTADNTVGKLLKLKKLGLW
jgi:hypothetical protein